MGPHVVWIAIETVVLRRKGGCVEVLLIRRPPDDKHYANLLHSPGTLLRGSDAAEGENEVPLTFDKAFTRLEQGELHLSFVGERRKVGELFFRTTRGPTLCLVYACQIAGEPKVGQFYPVDSLPKDLVKSHSFIIPMAVRAFTE